MLVCPPLARIAPHFYTSRAWRFGSPDADRAAAWIEVARAAGVTPDRLMRTRQVHGATAAVYRSGRDVPPGARTDADILATSDPGLALAVRTADCVPILIADPGTGAVAAAHAGWRGLALRAALAAVRVLAGEWGSRPEDLIAAIGPSIGPCCYEVGQDVHDRFAAGFSREQLEAWFEDGRRPGHWRLDLRRSASDQLVEAGVDPANVHSADLCTSCHPEWFCSHRRQGADAGRLLGVIRPRRSGIAGSNQSPVPSP